MLYLAVIFAISVVFAGIIVLQVFLSRVESRWPGLIIPIISFLLGLLYPLSMVPADGITVLFIFEVIAVWFLANIPTFIFLAIYFGCQAKHRQKRQLDKMNIQDLE